MHRMRSNCAPDFDHLDNSFHQSNDDANERFAHSYRCQVHSVVTNTHSHESILFELHLGSANIDTDTAQHSGFMLSTQKTASHVTHGPWPTMQIQCNFVVPNGPYTPSNNVMAHKLWFSDPFRNHHKWRAHSYLLRMSAYDLWVHMAHER